MNGYTGKILHVDLTTKECSVETPDEKIYRRYLGGAALGSYYVMKEMSAGIDPLSPESILAFTLSPVTGAAISGNARHCVSGKSPQTGTLANGEAGGYWAPELKFAGFDGIIIKGKSTNPVYLWVKDGESELRDASQLWGKDTGDTQDLIREELGDERIKVAQIGPGGENLVSFAGIVNELKHFNGRNGLGAVMGSKNLKAIAVRGSGKPVFADPDKIKAMARESVRIMKEVPFYDEFRQGGTTLNVEWNSPVGGLPTKNWTSGTFDQKSKLEGMTYRKEMMDKDETCWACIQKCKRGVKKGLKGIDPRFGGSEYETIGMCGSNLMISDLEIIARINQLASRNAVDTISLGGIIGMVMEAFEKGFITSEQLDGLELRFGDGEAALALAEKIINREGVGDILAQGTAKAAGYFGPEVERIAVHVKNKEFPAHMPHTKASLALAYAVNGFGPDHVSSEHDGGIASEPVGERLQGLGFYESHDPAELNLEKARLLSYSQRWNSAIDSVCVCSFIFNTWSIFGLTELMDFINAATGWGYTLHEFMLLGERRVNMLRAFNAREGFSSKDDILPERLFEDPLEGDSPSKGRVIDRERFEACKEYYYELNGWDSVSGNPRPYKMRELGLNWFHI